MIEGEPRFEEKTPAESQEKSEKEIAWENEMQKVEKIPNLESGAKKIVTALNISEIPTSQSCEGHLEKGEITLPFVEMSTPNQPGERFIGQEKIIPEVVKKYSVPAEDVKTMLLHSAPWEEFKGAEETPDYRKWREENKKVAENAGTLLKDFHQNSTTPENIRLTIKEQNAGQFEISNTGDEQDLQIPGEKRLTREQKSELSEKLLKYQREMDDFAEFLKDKYFKE